MSQWEQTKDKNQHGQHLKFIKFATPLFSESYKAFPFSSPNSTKYLMIPKIKTDNKIISKFICPSFTPQSENKTFIVLDGDDFAQYLHSKRNSYFFMTEQEVWALIYSLLEAFIAVQSVYPGGITHFKQYSIRRINKLHYKLLFHSAMNSQLDAANQKKYKWFQFYLSPQQLEGNFIPQKSIVFSLGAMLLNICSYPDASRIIYSEKTFEVQWAMIKQKLTIARKFYSKEMVSFIQCCLIENPDQRYNFSQLRCYFMRKMDKVFMKQSQLLSQIVIADPQHKNLQYDLSFADSYGYSRISPIEQSSLNTPKKDPKLSDSSKSVGKWSKRPKKFEKAHDRPLIQTVNPSVEDSDDLQQRKSIPIKIQQKYQQPIEPQQREQMLRGSESKLETWKQDQYNKQKIIKSKNRQYKQVRDEEKKQQAIRIQYNRQQKQMRTETSHEHSVKIEGSKERQMGTEEKQMKSEYEGQQLMKIEDREQGPMSTQVNKKIDGNNEHKVSRQTGYFNYPQQKQIDFISYRGTFGGNRWTQNERTPKKSEPNYPEHNIETKTYKGKLEQNLQISVCQQFNDQQIQTPKGFGQFVFTPNPTSQTEQQIKPIHLQRRQSNSDYIINSIRNSYGNKALYELPKPLTSLSSLSLEQCLCPLQDIKKRIAKIGIWIEGDLYFGEIKNGHRCGLGLEIFPNGQYYYGYFNNDLFEGEGFYFWDRKQYFIGYFRKGQKYYGSLYGPTSYLGYFQNNRRHGEGICWYSNGQIYNGDWLKGKRHGHGFYQDYNNNRYLGNWEKGKKYGQGVLENEFFTIAGFWNEDTVEGETLIEYNNGSVYRGETGKNLEKISGEYFSKSGTIYEGSYKDDEPYQGVLTYSNGDQYKGEFLNNKRHGYGQYYYNDGRIYKGNWKNGEKVTENKQ